MLTCFKGIIPPQAGRIGTKTGTALADYTKKRLWINWLIGGWSGF
jgi:hypothetical protein